MPEGAPVELERSDIREPESVNRALREATGAVNAVSLYAEHGDLTFRAVHVDGAEQLAKSAREIGLERLVHISGIGSDPESDSPYVAARGQGEEKVRHAFPEATVLRPSVLFGPGDAFLRNLDKLTRAPVVPLFGTGNTRLQPVFVEDVATGLERALKLPEAPGRIFELGGGAIYTYREVLQAVLAHRNRWRPLLPIPFPIWRTLAALSSRILASPPLTPDQVILMEQDNTVGGQEATFADLGIEPASLEDKMAESLP